MQKRINSIRYKTINECLSAYFNCDKSDIPTEGYWEWCDASGDYHKMPQSDALKQIRKKQCWGWVENKTTIHYFVRKTATLRQVIRMISHELGHMQRPYHKSVIEERKSEIYSEIAIAAYDISKQIVAANE